MVKDPASTYRRGARSEVVAQGQAHPHPGGRDRRHPARPGRARSDDRVAAARHPRSRRPAVRGPGRLRIQRRDPAHARCARSSRCTPTENPLRRMPAARRARTCSGCGPRSSARWSSASSRPGGILRHSRWRGLRPDKSPADVVRESYSLTMIPDWFAALDQAYAMLKPGGTIGIVDFFVAREVSCRRIGEARLVDVARSGRCGSVTTTCFSIPTTFPICRIRFETARYSQRRGTLPYIK